jgi:hypothetical protein
MNLLGSPVLCLHLIRRIAVIGGTLLCWPKALRVVEESLLPPNSVSESLTLEKSVMSRKPKSNGNRRNIGAFIS